MDLLVIGAKQKDFNLLPKNQINLKDFDYSMLSDFEFKQGDFISALVSEDVFLILSERSVQSPDSKTKKLSTSLTTHLSGK